MAEIVYRTEDCPDANGRTPTVGDLRWKFQFPLDNGDTLILFMGSTAHLAMIEMLQNEADDDAFQAGGGYRT